MSSPHALFVLQRWYVGECNGDWEHGYGVHIDTLENPGWPLTIDLTETSLETAAAESSKVERSGMSPRRSGCVLL